MNAKSSQRRRVLAVIPAFNEEGRIGSVVGRTLPHVDGVLVVDDGSADGTTREAQEAGAAVLRLDRNGGKGTALAAGFAHARRAGATAVVTLDGDGQHDPAAIPALVRPVLAGAADIVIGSRFRGTGTPAPLYRVLGLHVLTETTNLGSGVRVTDSQSGLRAFSLRALERVRLRERGFGVESEMQFEARKHRLRVAEVPVVVSYPEQARRSPVAHGFGAWWRILHMTARRRPLALATVPWAVLRAFAATARWGVGARAAARSRAGGEPVTGGQAPEAGLR